MERAIVLSIKPKWAEKILNGEKTIELRKKFPKDFVGWVYLYVTKDKKNPIAQFSFVEGWFYKIYSDKTCYAHGCTAYMKDDGNGKVVCRFWCDHITQLQFELWKNQSVYEALIQIDIDQDLEEERTLLATNDSEDAPIDGSFSNIVKVDIIKNACLNIDDIRSYLGDGLSTCFAINISKLEIFEEPKELKDFDLIKAPQNYQYIEEEK